LPKIFGSTLDDNILLCGLYSLLVHVRVHSSALILSFPVEYVVNAFSHIAYIHSCILWCVLERRRHSMQAFKIRPYS